MSVRLSMAAAGKGVVKLMGVDTNSHTPAPPPVGREDFDDFMVSDICRYYCGSDTSDSTLPIAVVAPVTLVTVLPLHSPPLRAFQLPTT